MWNVLVDPATVPRLMPVTEVLIPWAPGARFVWRFDMNGRPHDVAGDVLRFEPPGLVEYDYGDPLAAGIRHRVRIELSTEGPATRVSITQDRNRPGAEHAHAEGGWRLALGNLKAIVEGR